MADETRYRKVISSCYTRLLEDLEPSALLDRMIENNFLPMIVIRDIKESGNTTEKNRKIIDRVLTKGPKGYKHFLRLLKKSDNEFVAEMLISKETELIAQHGNMLANAPVPKSPAASGNMRTVLHPRPVEVPIPQQPNLKAPASPKQTPPEELPRPDPGTVDIRAMEASGGSGRNWFGQVFLGETRGETSQGPAMPDMSRLILTTDGDSLSNEGASTLHPNLIAQPTSTAEQPGLDQIDNQAEIAQNEFADLSKHVNFDGRIIDLPKEKFEAAIQTLAPIKVGGFSQVYLAKPYVIKKIECKGDAGKQKSATCEMLAARLMHFAIVPLLAMGQDVPRETYYFLFPYLEGGDLREKLQQDKEKIEKKEEPVLKKKNRMRILFQIACAMEFLHRKIENFRSSYVHRDITTSNIVLDKNFNARLLDFGLSRQYTAGKEGVTLTQSDLIGTPGYFTTSQSGKLTVTTDCYNFGIVILEVLSSEPAMDKSGLRLLPSNFDHFYDDHDDNIEAVWQNDEKGAKSLIDLASSCSAEKKITAKDVKERLGRQLRQCTIDLWACSDKKSEEDICDICMINPVKKDVRLILGHPEKCQLYVCVACLRNSYLNPIECHSCLASIIPPIGHGWAALLIAGNDCKRKENAKLFKKDIQDIEKAITSRHPLIMGISNVFSVSPENPGEEEKLLPRLEDSFRLLGNKKFNTLLIYYTGHHDHAGFTLGSSDEVLEDSTLHQWIQMVKDSAKSKKVIIIMDCCKAPPLQISLDGSYFQINSCGPNQNTANPEGECCLFTNFFLQALKGKSSSEACLLSTKYQVTPCSICSAFKSTGGFLNVENLHDFISKHVKEYENKWGLSENHTIDMYSKGERRDYVFAYFIDQPAEFKFSLQGPRGKSVLQAVAPLPDTYEELLPLLFKKYQAEFRLPPLDTAEFADILMVSVSYGPRLEDKHELNSLEKLEAAWNGKQQLFVSMRRPDNLHSGHVGIFTEHGTAENVLEVLTQESLKSMCESKEDRVEVDLQKNDARTLWKAVKDNKDQMIGSKKELVDLLNKIKRNQIQKTGKLVFTFPHKSIRSGAEKFFTVKIEP